MSQTAEALATAAFQQAKQFLGNRDWRLDNLYAIKDKDTGEAVQFKRNRAQRFYGSTMWYRDVIVKARQLGFSTDIAVKILDDCLFRSNTAAGIVDFKLDDATKKLDKCRFAYERLPAEIREAVRLDKDNESEMEFSNGSIITAGTGYRGDTPQILHISEYGKISSDKPDQAREIKTGAIEAVPRSGKIYVESTAHGQGGEFYEMVERARKLKESGKELTPLDFKLHFFPWYLDPSYRLNQAVTITQELAVYFEELRLKYGIILGADQKAWYAQKLEALGPDDIKSEYPSTIDEAFFNSLEGSYYKHEMLRARREKRICKVFFDPTRPVHTCSDLGVDDENFISFFQHDGFKWHWLDCASSSGEGVSFFPRILQQKAIERGFIYGKHFGPHDLEVRDWSSQVVQPRWKIAEGLGVKFAVVPAPFAKADGIEAVRQVINISEFDEVHCAQLIACLDNFRKKWNKQTASWASEHVHDWASHGNDSVQTGALGMSPDKEAKKSGRPKNQGNRSAWSA